VRFGPDVESRVPGSLDDVDRLPTSTISKSCSTSFMYILMQPCDTFCPIDQEDGVPCISTPDAEVAIARVPSGLPGPGAM